MSKSNTQSYLLIEPNALVVEEILVDPGVSESEHDDTDFEDETPYSKEQSMVSKAPSMSLQGVRYKDTKPISFQFY